jgi:hypothetical protein
MVVPDARLRMAVADAGLLVPLVWRSRKGLTGPRHSVAADWPGALADAGIGRIVSCTALR